MSSRAEPEVPTLVQAYAEERRRLLAARVRWTAAFALLPISVAAVVNVLVFTDRLGERLATLAVQGGLCLLALAVTASPVGERRAVAVAMLLVMSMGTSLFWSLSLSPGDL
ncbi:MAG TPA: hypothetical protein VEM57_02770, partial [Candidatus Binatus sp.]|nr:hypothetical protein [Candidatus Binatus sp.]